MYKIIKIFKAEILKLSIFMFCFSSSIAYLMFETNTNFDKLFSYIINTIKF